MGRRPLSATAAEIRKLPWPPAILKGEPLSIRDAYKAGSIISTRLRVGSGKFSSVTMMQIAQALGASKATLHRTVQVFQMAKTYKLEKRLDEIQPTLLHNISRLPEKQRKKFLQQALKEKWTKREIVNRVVEALPEGGRGRRDPTFLSALRRASKLQIDARVSSRDLSSDEKKEAKALLKDLNKRLSKIEKALA